jgi:hypothetical protein
MLTSIIHRCPNKIIKTFLIEDFFICHPCQRHLVVHFELPISPRICEKIWKDLNRILRALGETDSCKNKKSLDTVPLGCGCYFWIENFFICLPPVVTLFHWIPSHLLNACWVPEQKSLSFIFFLFSYERFVTL